MLSLIILPVTVTCPPIYPSHTTLSPPSVCIDPSVVSVAFVVLSLSNLPVAVILPAANTSHTTLSPPSVCIDPSVPVVAFVVLSLIIRLPPTIQEVAVISPV